MKVLHIINSLSSGGAEKLLQDFIILGKDNYNVQLDLFILSEENNVFEKKLLENNVKIYKSKYRNIYNPLNIFIIRKLIKNNNYDIVHAHLFPSFYWTALASLFLNKKIKLILTEHNTHNKRREKKYLRLIEKLIYSRYNKIISISDMTQANLINWLKINAKKVNKYTIIENGINVKKFKEAEPYKKSQISKDFNQDTKLICMIGRFSEQKDQITLIRALELLDDDIHLLLIGEGKLKEDCVNLVKRISLERRVHFLGFREDVDRILKTVDIVVLSSNWEGFGLAAVEGMAAGKPVIASNVPGLREVVKDAGLIFEKGDYIDLSKKIKLLLQNKDIYIETQEKCLKRAEKYDIYCMVKNYFDIYYNVLK